MVTANNILVPKLEKKRPSVTPFYKIIKGKVVPVPPY
jgi:hypothetical protein